MSKTSLSDKMRQVLEDNKAKPVQTPIQEVRPVDENTSAPKPRKPATRSKSKDNGDVHVNFWIDKALGDRLKIYSAKERKSITQLCIELLEANLPKY
jgi:hypothetical protein